VTCTALLLVLISPAAPAQPLAVRSATLRNGMKVLIAENHHIPRAAMHLFYKVGSRNEQPGITGISHFLEHMMFSGAAKYGRGEFDRQMEQQGGNDNAYTTADMTVYTDWFPSSELEHVMDMEADRMVNTRFDPEAIESERRVVADEQRTRFDNNNLSLLYDRLNSTAYVSHPYRWPIVGQAEDMQRWSAEDVRNQFQLGYGPNNCVLVIVGDVSTARALELTRTYFEPIAPRATPPPVRTREPRQEGERRVVIGRPAQLAVALYSFHAPAAADADYLPVRLLGAILAEGHSSRLYRALVGNGQMANSVSWSYGLSLDPGQLIFAIEARSGSDIGRVEQSFTDELDRIASAPVPAEELARARSQLGMNLYREMKTTAGKADLLGKYEIYLGSFQKLFSVADDLERVGAVEVQRVAKAYLAARNRTVALLLPEDGERGLSE